MPVRQDTKASLTMDRVNPALAVVSNSETTLVQLARTINAEHRQVVRSGQQMVEHAIRAGEALMQANSQCNRGEWLSWLGQNFEGHPTMAVAYMRVAFYQEDIRALNLTKHRDIREYLRGLPGPTSAQDPGYPDAVREQATLHLDAGKSTREVAQLLGVPRRTIRDWADPGGHAEASRESKRQRRAARPHTPRSDFEAPPDRQELARRVRQVVAAHQSGDRIALRGALYELATTCQQWCDHLDKTDAAFRSDSADLRLASSEER